MVWPSARGVLVAALLTLPRAHPRMSRALVRGLSYLGLGLTALYLGFLFLYASPSSLYFGKGGAIGMDFTPWAGFWLNITGYLIILLGSFLFPAHARSRRP